MNMNIHYVYGTYLLALRRMVMSRSRGSCLRHHDVAGAQHEKRRIAV